MHDHQAYSCRAHLYIWAQANCGSHDQRQVKTAEGIQYVACCLPHLVPASAFEWAALRMSAQADCMSVWLLCELLHEDCLVSLYHLPLLEAA